MSGAKAKSRHVQSPPPPLHLNGSKERTAAKPHGSYPCTASCCAVTTDVVFVYDVRPAGSSKKKSKAAKADEKAKRADKRDKYGTLIVIRQCTAAAFFILSRESDTSTVSCPSSSYDAAVATRLSPSQTHTPSIISGTQRHSSLFLRDLISGLLAHQSNASISELCHSYKFSCSG